MQVPSEVAVLVNVERTVMTTRNGKYCGMSCPYLKQYYASYSCNLFNSDLFTGVRYVHRHQECVRTEVKEW